MVELVALLVAFLVGLAFAHGTGILLYGALRVRPGHIRRAMPSLPLGQVADGPRAAVRWRRTVRRAEGKLLAELTGGAAGVSTADLAPKVHEDEEVVDAALARLRQEMPCRLRVTRSGRMLHDFAAADVEALAQRRRAARPLRALFFVLAALANVGAVWPVLTVLVIALVSLEAVWGNEGVVSAGVLGLCLIGGVLVATLVFGWALDFLVRPLVSAPRLGPAGPEQTPELVETERDAADPTVIGWFGSSSDNRRSSSSSSGGGSLDLDSDSGSGGGGLAQLVVILFLLAVIVLCLFTIAVWLRGLWRALARVPPDHGRTSPTIWVRTAERVDWLERYIPTNDLVGRVWRALRRAHGERRPADRELGPRILIRARRNGGHVTALEIALAEALDVHEAIEAGARLCQMVGGETVVVGGELGFRFPDPALRSVRVAECPDLMAEYLAYADAGPLVVRNAAQDPGRLPVNLVGLQLGHLQGAARLAVGTWLMAGSAVVVLTFAAYPGLCLAAVACAVGATTLVTVVRYTAAGMAALGVRRDFRRACFQEIGEALEAGRDRVDLAGQVNEVASAMEGAWPGLDPVLLEKEIYGVASDLDLEPTPGSKRGTWSIAALRVRLDRVRAATPDAPEADGDPVMHDADLQTDRIKVLA